MSIYSHFFLYLNLIQFLLYWIYIPHYKHSINTFIVYQNKTDLINYREILKFCGHSYHLLYLSRVESSKMTKYQQLSHNIYSIQLPYFYV